MSHEQLGRIAQRRANRHDLGAGGCGDHAGMNDERDREQAICEHRCGANKMPRRYLAGQWEENGLLRTHCPG